MVSLYRPVYSKITLTYSPTWQTDCRRIAFKVKRQGGPFLVWLKPSLHVYCLIKVPERAPTKTWLVYLCS